MLFLNCVFVGNWCETRAQSFLRVGKPNSKLAIHIAVFLNQFQNFLNLYLSSGRLRQHVLPFLLKIIESLSQNFLFLSRCSSCQKVFAFLHHVIKSSRVLGDVVGDRLREE